MAQEHEDTSTPAEISAGKQQKKGKPRGKPFKPGQSGNPAGKPPGTLSLVGLLKKRLAEIHPDQKRSFAEVFIDNVIQDAMDLDGPSRKLIMNYIEGMPKQQMLIDTNKDTLGELTDFFRAVGQGKPTIKADITVTVPPEPLPAPTPTNESGGPTSA